MVELVIFKAHKADQYIMMETYRRKATSTIPIEYQIADSIISFRESYILVTPRSLHGAKEAGPRSPRGRSIHIG
jgi:hypothetical protein